jgi:hypothetical protein
LPPRRSAPTPLPHRARTAPADRQHPVGWPPSDSPRSRGELTASRSGTVRTGP